MAVTKSPWIIHYDASSCNGCDIEVLACLMPLYDVERLGIINVGNPKHADIFLVTGSVNEQNREVIQNIYNQMPDPKVVVAVGICACSGGIFAECYNVSGGIDKVIPVDVYVPGCAARPEAIIDGVAKGLVVLSEKSKKLKVMKRGMADLTIEKAVIEDAQEILNLQKSAYQSEGELYNDPSIDPLNQTLDDLQNDFKSRMFFKAMMGGKLVGSVRGFAENDTAYVSRLIVHPVYQNFGIGKKLMTAVEDHFRWVKRFELFTGHRSKRNIYFYQKLGYRIFKKEKVSEKRERIFLEKVREG
jgi:ech hydrogenase subunit C